MPRRLTRAAVRLLDSVARLAGRSPEIAAHHATGRSGEEEAYFYLRQLGYVMVARNWRSPHRKGELDLVGWDGDVLCFIEVKTRSSRDFMPAEAAVDHDKQRALAAIARDYVRRLAGKPTARFDVVSIYCENKTTDITLFKGAFALS
jgi:putative endonuclease